MKKIYSFIFLFFVFNLGLCQEAKLRILGNSKYSEIAEYKVLLLNFENNPEVCNPLTQNKTIEIQVSEFNDILKSQNIVFKFMHKETLQVDPERSKSYELFLSLDINDYKIQKIINSSGINLVKTYYKFYENKFINEDKKAILAFQNSENKAKEIATILNYKITDIISIDDDTSDVNNIVELLGINDIDEERIAMMNSVLERLNEFEMNSNPKKDGAYNLWVTYRIKPNK